jgi:hypothetical protein
LSAAGGWVAGAGGLVGVGGRRAHVGADVEEAIAGRGHARRLLRVGVDGVGGRLVARLGRQGHAEDVIVHERRVAGELLAEVAALRELVEGAVARPVLGVVVGDLGGGDALEVRDGGGLVGRAHARLPGRDADGDEDADDRDDDHQLDERKTPRAHFNCYLHNPALSQHTYTNEYSSSSITRCSSSRL